MTHALSTEGLTVIAHQCPRCELRFRDEPEVRDHLVRDHGVDPEALEHQFSVRGQIHPHRDPPRPHRDE